MFIELTYPISPETTVLEAGFKPPLITPRSRISEGRHSNTSYIEMFAHTGTHIDAPWHFNDAGCQILDFAIEDLVFSHVHLIEIPVQPWQAIPAEAFALHRDQLSRCDALLIYTGFSTYRQTHPEVYVEETPGLSVKAAQLLATYPRLRCIGVDFISIENVKRARETGFPTHHALLDDRQHPMILLEDANLTPIRGLRIQRLYLFPLRMAGLDASPVTAVAEVQADYSELSHEVNSHARS